MPRTPGPFPTPPKPDNPLEYSRQRDYQSSTDPRDLARALGEEKSHDSLASTKVMTPDLPQ